MLYHVISSVGTMRKCTVASNADVTFSVLVTQSASWHTWRLKFDFYLERVVVPPPFFINQPHLSASLEDKTWQHNKINKKLTQVPRHEPLKLWIEESISELCVTFAIGCYLAQCAFSRFCSLAPSKNTNILISNRRRPFQKHFTKIDWVKFLNDFLSLPSHPSTVWVRYDKCYQVLICTLDTLVNKKANWQ